MALEREFSWRRCFAWSVALALHAALLLGLTRPPLHVPAPGIDAVERDARAAWVPVDRVPARIPETVPAMPDAPRPRVRGEPLRAGTRVSPMPAVPMAASAAVDPPPPVARTLHHLDEEARALLPNEALFAAGPPPREGGYYTPGTGSEDDVFYRPRALDPNPSRFAHAWRPRGNALDDWLGRLVEATTGQVSVPLNAKFSLVCKASVAGMAGGCNIVRNGGTGVIVQRPPPAPWERSNRVQCRELRAALEAAEAAAQVAYVLDRLSALCSPAADEEGAANDEARRGAGLPGSAAAAPAPDQREDL